MSNSPTLDITDIPPLLQQAATPDAGRRRIVQFGMGAALVVSLQVAAITWLVPPWQQSGTVAATQSGVPNILISSGDEGPADDRGAGAGRTHPDTADLAVDASASAGDSSGLGPHSADSLLAEVQHQADDVETSLAAGTPDVDDASAEVTQANGTGTEANRAAALALNEVLPEIAPMPAPPARDVGFYPRPQVRPPHLLAKRPVIRVRAASTSKKTRTTTAAGPEQDWLANQSRGHFTLQMVSLSDGARFRQFTRSVPKSRYMAHVQVKKSGAVRHVLYRGVYKNRAAASRDAGQLAQITGVKPWIRRIDDVLKETARGA